MDTPRGLLVPNIKQVNSLSMLEIAQELRELQALGADNKLGQTHLTGGTFSISNIGSIGGTYASPVVMLPQVAICAIGRMQTVPRFDVNGAVVPTQTMCMSFGADHRVIDGATMGRFSNRVKQLLESPHLLLSTLR